MPARKPAPAAGRAGAAAEEAAAPSADPPPEPAPGPVPVMKVTVDGVRVSLEALSDEELAAPGGGVERVQERLRAAGAPEHRTFDVHAQLRTFTSAAAKILTEFDAERILAETAHRRGQKAHQQTKQTRRHKQKGRDAANESKRAEVRALFPEEPPPAPTASEGVTTNPVAETAAKVAASKPVGPFADPQLEAKRREVLRLFPAAN
jgi:hypothetical protein